MYYLVTMLVAFVTQLPKNVIGGFLKYRQSYQITQAKPLEAV